MNITPIAHISSPFKEKFGIPRQAGTTSIKSQIILEKEYRDPNALRGLENFSHIWIIWEFTEAKLDKWSPTVRPPRLGGNTRVGVFATRSPFRPNSLGLSCVKIDSIEQTDRGPVITVLGADLLDGTPIYDIKPYLPCFDRPKNASGSYSDVNSSYKLKVDFPDNLFEKIAENDKNELFEILSEDPRPSYQNDSTRIYGMGFMNYEIKFTVDGDTLFVKDVDIE